MHEGEAAGGDDRRAHAGRHPAAVIQELGKHMRKARIALVGHEPNMGELAAPSDRREDPAAVQEGRDRPDRFAVLPPKGKGELIWFVPPRMLRKLSDRSVRVPALYSWV